MLHKGAVATLLGVQDYKKVKFQGRDISSLAKGLSNYHQIPNHNNDRQDTGTEKHANHIFCDLSEGARK